MSHSSFLYNLIISCGVVQKWRHAIFNRDVINGWHLYTYSLYLLFTQSFHHLFVSLILSHFSLSLSLILALLLFFLAHWSDLHKRKLTNIFGEICDQSLQPLELGDALAVFSNQPLGAWNRKWSPSSLLRQNVNNYYLITRNPISKTKFCVHV